MYKSMFRPEVIRRIELCFFRPYAKLPSLPRTSEIHHVVISAERSTSVYINLHFQPCAGSEPDCNCCLSNKYTYMQLRSPEVTRVNFHLSPWYTHNDCKNVTHSSTSHCVYTMVIGHGMRRVFLCS